MRKSFIALGILIALTPQLGFPEAWKNFFITIAGLLIILLVSIPRFPMRKTESRKKENSFTENTPN
jgi:hypothetical protein